MQALNWDNVIKLFPHINISALILENMVFRLADRYSKSYTGGQWTVDTFNGSMYLVAPTGSYDVVNDDNGYAGTMNEKTFGCVLTVIAQNFLLNSRECVDTNALIDHWDTSMNNAVKYLDSDSLSDYYSFLD